MTCKCVKIYRTSAVTLTGGSLYLTIPGIQFNTLSNYTQLKVIVCQSLPSTAGTAQVYLSDGITNVPVYNMSGNYLRADEIDCRKCYPMVFGNDPVHASLKCGVCPSSYAAGSTSAATASALSDSVALKKTTSAAKV